MSAAEVRKHWQGVSAQAQSHAAGCELNIVDCELGNPCARYAKLHLSALDGLTIGARLIVPKGAGTHPVVLMFHDATRGIRGWQHMTRFIALGYAVLALKNRAGAVGVLVDEPISASDGLGIAMRLEAEKAPPIKRSVSENTQEKLCAILSDALVLAHAAARIESLDSERMLCWGEGLGGGIALATAALIGAQGAAALNPLPSALDASAELIDVAAIVQGYDRPVLLGSCLLDLQATPEAQDVLASGLKQLQHLRYPRYGHERVNAFEDELMCWLIARHSEFDCAPANSSQADAEHLKA